ncbi:glycosyltransferase family 4 protein [Gracilimonas mengyeensis]|nr:glycosyltransferase family 4 protein [Gracilimonas mengyeensis]
MISPRIPAPPQDGGALYVYNTIKGLHQRGHYIELASFNSNLHTQAPDQLETYASVNHLDINFKSYGLAAFIKSLISGKPVQIVHRMDRSVMSEILDKSNLENLDVILLEGIHTAWFIELLRNKFPEKKIILRESNVEYLLLKRNAKREANPVKKVLLYHQATMMKKFEAEALQKVDAFTAISEYDRQLLSALVPKKKSAAIYPSIEIPEIRGLERDPYKMLMFADWNWQPNIQGLEWFLKEVWPPLKKAQPKVSLTVCGKGMPDSLLSIFNNDTQLHYKGFVEDLEEFKQRCGVMLAPLFSGSGIKLKIMESLASGLPVITTNSGAEGIPGLKENAHYLKANNAEDFLQKINKLLNDCSLQKTLSTQGRTLVKRNFSYKAQSQKLESFIQKVINSPNS